MSADRICFRNVLALVLAVGLAPASLAAGASPPAGEQIVGEVCSGCHGQGLLGAPKIGDSSAWQGRFSKAGSVKVLAETAEHGKGNMPPRGGESSLTDSDVESAVQYMLGKSGVTF